MSSINERADEYILDVKELTVKLRIGRHAYEVVDHLNFHLEKGKTLALVGESGCGKTMAALSLLGILPSAALPPTGSVLYNGMNLLSCNEAILRKIRGSRIAMIFQDPSGALNPVYTIGDQLMETVQLHMNLDDEAARLKAISALQEVGIPSAEERFDEYPHQLSGGLKQRVMIAMALVCQPDILIADEPTTALDMTIQAQVLELMKDLQKRNGMSVLLITHDMGVVAEMADDVIVMYASQEVEYGSVYEIFDHMAHPYTKGLFESRPNPDSRRGGLLPIKGSVPPMTRYPTGCRFHPRCPYAMEKCKIGNVPIFKVDGQENHLSKCWLLDHSEESMNKLIEAGDRHVNSTP